MPLLPIRSDSRRQVRATNTLALKRRRQVAEMLACSCGGKLMTTLSAQVGGPTSFKVSAWVMARDRQLQQRQQVTTCLISLTRSDDQCIETWQRSTFERI